MGHGVPMLQARHCAPNDDPTILEADPMGQSVHDGEAHAALYEPAGQDVHPEAPALEALPAK